MNADSMKRLFNPKTPNPTRKTRDEYLVYYDKAGKVVRIVNAVTQKDIPLYTEVGRRILAGKFQEV